ncbi:hypothetical protein [Falsarthrobacter nasiphocae]|uniref:Uncharacterized protein n=1 Tax=Falsarthrobacter nasiphocae TaxID=189863 RepID=A0AAE4C6E4_9MICC|nr:hypothetical protein [Falsarthrobacter nasiphocae]MDR6892493.1 hypothetical protein [Falsarthrobacter nasiphocae]
MKISGAVLVLGVALAALVGAVWSGPVATAVTMSAVSAVFAYAYPYLLGIPAKRTVSTVGAIASILAVTSPLYAPSDAPLRFVPLYVGFGVAASFIVQLLRGTGQVRRMESLIGLSAGIFLMGSGAGWVAVAQVAQQYPSQEIIQQASRGQGAALCVAVCALVGALIPLIQPRILSSTSVVIVGVGLFFGILVGSTTELALGSSVVLGGITGALTGAVVTLSQRAEGSLTKRTHVASGLGGIGLLGAVAFFGATFV